ncbi:uncharacterized protein AMSG_06634 [Thecamonas trahens ATCC 50062]|uniref:DUF445 domain-containing protein n=1 Tax=Thecamonas trahens ATCC 50062 TaxID=461836 RepID=A0A0L0DEU7_THETB|nr:hypothetical protein AMSG_06634 [Thecamonas trahens ATCC 50062]KNC50745.1 hypothetical protein AMSG_06634 [Thecamonas trahens ATCC 50062]|eukprot:XP_013756710.1 hypothetical protein AMSG_06634 [Thecamonas trahens ATCC 50062]
MSSGHRGGVRLTAEAETDFFGVARRPTEPWGKRLAGWFTNKGSLSNMATFSAMILGLIIVASTPGGVPDRRKVTCPPDAVSGSNVFGQYILAFGLFGFAGGVTNWLAVKMLFDNVCGLPGSGVIPKRFREIRASIKDMFLKTFFERRFLENYLEQKAGQLTASINIEDKIQALLESPQVDAIIDSKLGMMLAMLGIDPASLKPIIKPFVLDMGSDMAPLLMDMFDANSMLNVDTMREEVEQMMDVKLQELTPDAVKRLIEDVIREHLGWLIVWGNVFGGVLGLLSRALGY